MCVWGGGVEVSGPKRPRPAPPGFAPGSSNLLDILGGVLM